MMERVEATITIAEEQTEAYVLTGYVSGLVEAVHTQAGGAADLSIAALEPDGTARSILGVSLNAGQNEFAPRTPIVNINNTPVEYATDFPVMEKIPVYGTLIVSVSDATAGDTFNVAIYLSNSNPNGQ